jgi:trans-2,3-dihydro-3-hydroxyanthranilate isomerase
VWAYTWVDVFATRPLAGNQLCVFHDAGAMAEDLMSRITRELNHSETTFLQPSATADVKVRIWIPSGRGAEEIPFAGHPIIGSACVFAARTGATSVLCETGMGLRVPVQVRALDGGGWEATMEQPLPRLVWARTRIEGLAAALGVAEAEICSDLPVEAVDNGMQTVIIPLRSVEAVDRCLPDMARLRALLGRAGCCTLVFAMGGREAGSDIRCRVFSPFDAVGEDPATGSANGPLGAYVVRHNLTGKRVLMSEQGDLVGRPSRLRIHIGTDESGAVRTIQVGGRVHEIGSGSFRV